MPQASTKTARRPTAKPAPKVRRQLPAKAAPRVGIVSLGCPKALVDSERIITKLRAEGYVLSRRLCRRRRGAWSTPAASSTAPSRRASTPSARRMAENGRVIVTGCFGVEEARIRAAHPGVLAVTGPHQYEQVVAAVHEAVPPLHDPFLDLVPPEGLRLTPRHYAYLKISEGCNNRCSFCIIPQLRGDLASRPAAHVMAEAERLVQGRRQGAAGHQPGHQRLRPRHQVCREPVEGRAAARPASSTCAQALGSLGAWVRLHYVYPYPHVDQRAAADGRGQDPALPRHPLPARLARGAQGHAPPGAPGEDARAHRAAGARSAPTSPSARPSSSASPARPRRTSRSCSTG